MMNKKTLYLLRLSPFTNQHNVELCCDTLTMNDSVVLMDDGCYTLNHQLLNKLILSCENVYIIKTHAIARGLSLSNNTQAIDITKLNQYIFEYSNSVTWQ
jgi:tRNA 2-thiouridine synthesizing protein B